MVCVLVIASTYSTRVEGHLRILAGSPLPYDVAASALVWFAMKRVTALALLAIASAVPSACRGSDSQQRTSQNRLITLGHSIGGIRLGEPRRSVEETLGPGTSRRRG